MSQNVEIVRRMFERYEAGDVTLSDYAEDAEWLPDASVFPETEAVRGRDAIRSWVRDVASAFESPELVFAHVELRDVGQDRVLSRGQWGGQGAASGIAMRSSLSGVWLIRHGKIARVEWFFDHDKALEAAGLEE